MQRSSCFVGVAVVVALALAMVIPGSLAVGAGGRIEKAPYGTTADGITVDEYTLTNASGVEVKVYSWRR